jgi:hypothetical protein
MSEANEGFSFLAPPQGIAEDNPHFRPQPPKVK